MKITPKTQNTETVRELSVADMVTEELVAKYGHDPLYNDAIFAPDAHSQEKAYAKLAEEKGEQVVNDFIELGRQAWVKFSRTAPRQM